MNGNDQRKKKKNVSLKKAIYLKDRTSFPTAATLIFQRTHPNPWLLSLALLAIQEENQPVYWSSLEQLIWSEVTDPASKPRGLW